MCIRYRIQAPKSPTNEVNVKQKSAFMMLEVMQIVANMVMHSYVIELRLFCMCMHGDAQPRSHLSSMRDWCSTASTMCSFGICAYANTIVVSPQAYIHRQTPTWEGHSSSATGNRVVDYWVNSPLADGRRCNPNSCCQRRIAQQS